MADAAVFLDAPVAAASDDLLAVDQHGPDGDAAFVQAAAGLLESRIEKAVVGHASCLR